MTDTSPTTPLKIPVDRRVDPLTIALLRDVKDACASTGAGFVLAGATARDMLMWHLHGLKSSVATRDVDIAICAISWPAAEEEYRCHRSAVRASKLFRRLAGGLRQSTLLKGKTPNPAPSEVGCAVRDSSIPLVM
jgi:hypothetical protein